MPRIALLRPTMAEHLVVDFHHDCRGQQGRAQPTPALLRGVGDQPGGLLGEASEKERDDQASDRTHHDHVRTHHRRCLNGQRRTEQPEGQDGPHRPDASPSLALPRSERSNTNGGIRSAGIVTVTHEQSLPRLGTQPLATAAGNLPQGSPRSRRRAPSSPAWLIGNADGRLGAGAGGRRTEMACPPRLHRGHRRDGEQLRIGGVLWGTQEQLRPRIMRVGVARPLLPDLGLSLRLHGPVLVGAVAGCPDDLRLPRVRRELAGLGRKVRLLDEGKVRLWARREVLTDTPHAAKAT